MHNPIQQTAGFTIIEQVVTVLLIATLVSMAYAMYDEHLVTTQASEGVHAVMATGQQTNTLATRGSCLPSNGIGEQIGLFGDLKITGTYSAKKGLSCPTGCNATFTFNNEAPKDLQGKTLTASILNSGAVSLVPSETTLDAKYYQNEIAVIPKKSTDTCAVLPVSANPSNPAGAIGGVETDVATLPKGKVLQPLQKTYVVKSSDYPYFYNSLVANNPQAIITNMSLDEPQTFYRRANYRIYEPAVNRFATPKVKSSIMFSDTPTPSTYRYYAATMYYITYISSIHANSVDKHPVVYDIKGYPDIGLLPDGTRVSFELMEVYYVNKDKHLMLTLQGYFSNPFLAKYYPSVTIDLVDAEENAVTGKIDIIPRNISYKLDRIQGLPMQNGWFVSHAKTVDLGEISDASPSSLLFGWQHNILNKKKRYQTQWSGYDYYEGSYKVTLNKN